MPITDEMVETIASAAQAVERAMPRTHPLTKEPIPMSSWDELTDVERTIKRTQVRLMLTTIMDAGFLIVPAPFTDVGRENENLRAELAQARAEIKQLAAKAAEGETP